MVMGQLTSVGILPHGQMKSMAHATARERFFCGCRWSCSQEKGRIKNNASSRVCSFLKMKSIVALFALLIASSNSFAPALFGIQSNT
jgi:hypothetical protein